jgi:uncharacterized membrane protein
MSIFKKISLIVLIIAYIVAGTLHFTSPDGYIKIIPDYLPFKGVLNSIAGVCEVGFALLLIVPKTRPYGAWGIVLMLFAFMPVHINMIVNAPMQVGSLLVTRTIAWIRIPFQVLFVLWAYWYTGKE